MRNHKRSKILLLNLLISLICPSDATWCQQENLASNTHLKRPVTILDCIGMATIVNPNYFLGAWSRDEAATFSPDGNHFAVIVKAGNLETNTVDYRLLLFQTDQVTSSPLAEATASLSSSSTRPAIDSLTWLDNDTLAFLGENPGEQHQLYIVDRVSKQLRKLTDHPTSLINYAFSSDRKTFFFTALKREESTLNQEHYLVVGREDLSELISGTRLQLLSGLELFMMKPGMDKPTSLKVNGKLEGLSVPWPSPNGRYLAIQTIASRDHIPSDWYDYQILDQQTILSKQVPTTVNEYDLVDLTTEENRPLVDAPLGAWYSNLAWSDDSRSVVISGTNLPLDVHDPSERRTRAAHLFVAEVEVATGKVLPITHEDAIIRHWYAPTNELLLQSTNHRSFSNFEEGDLLIFRKTSEGWEQEPPTAVEEKERNRMTVVLEENMNTPPRLFARSSPHGKQLLLLDPNPQFASLTFGRVEEITFESAEKLQMKVGIYRPANYSTGTRYPLIIQTHGWTSDRFLIDGPDPNGMGAQPLVSKGFVVAQIGDEFFSAHNPTKAAMDEVEQVIGYLDRMGLIDPKRLGIVGFSATGSGVGYSITHSKYHFTAAVLSDTSDAGYFTYISSLNLPGSGQWFEAINGGLPFGVGLASWGREAPEFSLDKVATAMLLEPNEPRSVLELWEWFVGLRRLGKPAEMIYMPDAGHVVTRPMDRLVSQGTAVDWFDFWIKGHNDADPAKKEQYARWRQLRDKSRQ